MFIDNPFFVRESSYTQLDLEQTFSQIQKNKYFKTFCSGKQLIQTEK